jgi:hypothetical protein
MWGWVLQMVFNPNHLVYLNRHQHLITNVEIKRSSKGSATVRAAFTAPMSLSLFPFEYGPLMICAGWYHHELVQGVDGKWRSKSLREEIAYNQATVHVLLLVVGTAWVIHAAFRMFSGEAKPKKD